MNSPTVFHTAFLFWFRGGFLSHAPRNGLSWRQRRGEQEVYELPRVHAPESWLRGHRCPEGTRTRTITMQMSKQGSDIIYKNLLLKILKPQVFNSH